MFLDEEAANGGTDTRSVQASVAIDGAINGDDYVEGKGHGEHEIRLGLDLGELFRLCVRNAVVLLTTSVSLSVNSKNDQDKDKRCCDTPEVILGGPAIGWAEGIVNSQDQIDTEAKVEHQRDQLE